MVEGNRQYVCTMACCPPPFDLGPRSSFCLVFVPLFWCYWARSATTGRKAQSLQAMPNGCASRRFPSRYIPCIYVLNKIDQISIEELDIIYKIPHCVPISAHHKWNFDDLLEMMWGYLALVRVYTKPKGQLPDYESPVVMKQGKSKVENFCNSIHKTFINDFKQCVPSSSLPPSPLPQHLEQHLNDFNFETGITSVLTVASFVASVPVLHPISPLPNHTSLPSVPSPPWAPPPRRGLGCWPTAPPLTHCPLPSRYTVLWSGAPPSSMHRRSSAKNTFCRTRMLCKSSRSASRVLLAHVPRDVVFIFPLSARLVFACLVCCGTGIRLPLQRRLDSPASGCGTGIRLPPTEADFIMLCCI